MWNLLFLDDTIGFGGGDSIYTTNDGGETWQTAEIQAAPYFLINDIYFVDGQHGWAVGGSGEPIDAGIILNTSDGGASWHTVQDPASVFGRAVCFTDTLCGYVVGSNPPFFNSVVMSTKDGGESWKVQYISDITGGSWINDVIFINDKTGWCIGDYGFIWYTENGGDNWQRIDSGTHADLHRIKFIDNGRIGYIFGDDNTLLKLDRSIISIDDKPSITSSFFNKLYQNYPNPFNLSTGIVYHLHNYSQVRISVVNILGQEVCVLVDEKRTTGTYTIRWNASNYSSGIYFIKMQADNFLGIKKCILLK